jgi:hypothetical protein
VTSAALTQRIHALWRRSFPQFDDEEPWRRFLADERNPRAVVFYHPLRERLQGIKRRGGPESVGCALESSVCEKSIRYGDWIVAANPFPVQRYHILVSHDDHRPNPLDSDILDGMAFAHSTGFQLLLNLEGSGASVPEHLHWQGLWGVRFPAFREEYAGRVVFRDDEVEARLLAEPWGGFRLKPRSRRGCARIARVVCRWNGCFNLAVDERRTVLLSVRTRETPSLFPDFKFGGAEVAGVVYANTRDLFSSLDAASFEGAMREVVMQAKEHDRWSEVLASLLDA